MIPPQMLNEGKGCKPDPRFLNKNELNLKYQTPPAKRSFMPHTWIFNPSEFVIPAISSKLQQSFEMKAFAINK